MATYAHFGLHSALRLELPRGAAANNEAAVSSVGEPAWVGILVINSTFALLIIAPGFFGNWAQETSGGLIAMGITFFVNSVSEYKISHLKAHETFNLLIATNILHITIYFGRTVGLLLALASTACSSRCRVHTC